MLADPSEDPASDDKLNSEKQTRKTQFETFSAFLFKLVNLPIGRFVGKCYSSCPLLQVLFLLCQDCSRAPSARNTQPEDPFLNAVD